MKFIHLSDLHLGKSVNEYSMLEDQRYILRQIQEIILQENIDGVLIAGDVFDRPVPSEEAVKCFDDLLTELQQMKKHVFIISGNHDSDQRLNFASRLLTRAGIYIAGRYDGEVPCVDLEDGYGPLHIWMLPYVKASRVGHFFPREDTSTYDAAFRTALGKCRLERAERNVILVHQFVIGQNSDPEPDGSETALLNVGTIDKINYDCFDDFDYVAMGHIHGAQKVGRETCRYSGSPLKYSLNQREITRDKSVPVVELKEKGKVEVKLVPLVPRREIRHIRGKLEELLEHAEGREDYIYATLTDEDPQFEAMTRLREVYPYVMKLDYDNASTRRVEGEEEQLETEGRTFSQMMGDFYRMINQKEMSEEEWKTLEEVAREAGVIE